MKQITLLLVVTAVCVAVPQGQALASGSSREGRRPTLTVPQALRVCGKSPGEHTAVWVRGSFVPAVYAKDVIPPAGQEQGEIVASGWAQRAGRPGLRVGVGSGTLARYHQGIPPGPVVVRGVLSCGPPLLTAYAYVAGNSSRGWGQVSLPPGTCPSTRTLARHRTTDQSARRRLPGAVADDLPGAPRSPWPAPPPPHP